VNLRWVFEVVRGKTDLPGWSITSFGLSVIKEAETRGHEPLHRQPPPLPVQTPTPANTKMLVRPLACLDLPAPLTVPIN